MTMEAMHPRMQARIEQARLQKSLAEDRVWMAEIERIEAEARELADEIGAAVLETCKVLRRALHAHEVGSGGGALIRRFLPDRLMELRTVLATALPERKRDQSTPILSMASSPVPVKLAAITDDRQGRTAGNPQMPTS